ncbi:MAG: hypothetical protein FJ290_17080 [Planctomycetes bacterium]|nr:hypothetical protein [Planctomycetota bacterium]
MDQNKQATGGETLGKALAQALKLYEGILGQITQPGATLGQRACGLVGAVPLAMVLAIAILGIACAVPGASVPVSLLFWLALAGLLGFILLIPVALLVTARTRARDVVFSRVVPEYPLPSDVDNEVSELVEKLRVAARDWLKSKMPKEVAIKDDDVRANVFLARYENPLPEGTAFMLFLKEKFSRKMKDPLDLTVQFGPMQGATGRAFCLNRPQPSVRPLGGEWDDLHHLTKEQKKSIHEGLRWVLSLPVRRGPNLDPIAVANVDGLMELPGDAVDVLTKLGDHLAPIAEKHAKELALKCNAVKIEISTEKCSWPPNPTSDVTAHE